MKTPCIPRGWIAWAPAVRRVIGQLHRRHRSVEFRKFLDTIESQRPHFHIHFTPTYGSWINLVERWFAELTNKRIRRGVFRSVKELEAAIGQYIEVRKLISRTIGTGDRQPVVEVSKLGKNGDRHEISRCRISRFLVLAGAKIRACHHICRIAHFCQALYQQITGERLPHSS